MRRFAPVLSALALAALPGAADAADWLCNLSEDLVQLVCIADADPLQPAPVEAGPGAPRTVVRGVAFPLDTSQVYTVPLWTPPSDPEWVALLARATICYRSPGCSVTLAPSVQAQMPAGRLAAARGPRRR